eukprot:3520360-Rhodomonas_salina.2
MAVVKLARHPHPTLAHAYARQTWGTPAGDSDEGEVPAGAGSGESEKGERRVVGERLEGKRDLDFADAEAGHGVVVEDKLSGRRADRDRHRVSAARCAWRSESTAIGSKGRTKQCGGVQNPGRVCNGGVGGTVVSVDRTRWTPCARRC